MGGLPNLQKKLFFFILASIYPPFYISISINKYISQIIGINKLNI